MAKQVSNAAKAAPETWQKHNFYDGMTDKRVGRFFDDPAGGGCHAPETDGDPALIFPACLRSMLTK